MRLGKFARSLVMGTAALAMAATAQAADKTIKIGVIYDYTGPLAGGGSELQAQGAKIVIDYINSQGGVEGYMIDPIYADAQSKPDVAINEATRLIEQEGVDMLLGVSLGSFAMTDDIYISNSRLAAFIVAAACVGGLYVFLTRTFMGTAIRAISQNREIMTLMGVQPGKLYLVTSAIYGIALVLFIIFLPKGILGGIIDGVQKMTNGGKRAQVPAE